MSSRASIVYQLSVCVRGFGSTGFGLRPLVEPCAFVVVQINWWWAQHQLHQHPKKKPEREEESKIKKREKKKFNENKSSDNTHEAVFCVSEREKKSTESGLEEVEEAEEEKSKISAKLAKWRNLLTFCLCVFVTGKG